MKFLSNNVGEFANDEFRHITVMNTAAENPFSNGICERNHAIVDEMVCKISADQPDVSVNCTCLGSAC